MRNTVFIGSILVFLSILSNNVSMAQSNEPDYCEKFLVSENIDEIERLNFLFKKLEYYIKWKDVDGAGNISEQLLKIDKRSKLVRYALCVRDFPYSDFTKNAKHYIKERKKFFKSLEAVSAIAKKYKSKSDNSISDVDVNKSQGPIVCHGMQITDEITHVICD